MKFVIFILICFYMYNLPANTTQTIISMALLPLVLYLIFGMFWGIIALLVMFLIGSFMN